MDFGKLAKIDLIKGAGGGDPRKGLCIMEMVSYFDGADTVTDRPECACPVLTAFAIRLNDNAPNQEERNTLKPLLPMLTGSRDDASKARRVEHLVFQTARRITAPLFEQYWPEHAKAMREAVTYKELEVASKAAKKAAYDTAYAAAYAAADSAAYATAAYAATAAAASSSAADDAAYAADSAADAADAAYDTAYAAATAAKIKLWREARSILMEAIELGEHGKLDLEASTTDARADELMALIHG